MGQKERKLNRMLENKRKTMKIGKESRLKENIETKSSHRRRPYEGKKGSMEGRKGGDEHERKRETVQKRKTMQRKHESHKERNERKRLIPKDVKIKSQTCKNEKKRI